ncbi:MAG: 1-acyl-sn-glycerol-3-phosphate acyltransferase [Spirochaetaceae bacterium]
MKLLSPIYVKFVEGISKIDLSDAKELKEELDNFKKDKSRLIIAFRHPSKHDPALLMHVLNNKYSGNTHCQFVYGTWVLKWANSLVKWLFPGIGAIPLSNRGRSLEGMKEIRRMMIDGKHPLALAPEAQITYHNGKCGELEPGVISIAGWCKDDLLKLNIDKKVNILPLTLYYDYSKKADTSIKILKHLISPVLNNSDDLMLYTDFVISRVQKFLKADSGSQKNDNKPRIQKITFLCNSILSKAEAFFKIKPSGSLLNRVLTIRENCEQYINKNGVTHQLIPILRYMEVVDVLEYINPTYILTSTNKNRQIEYLLNLLDVINRLNGGTIATRFTGIYKEVKIITGSVIEYKTTINRTQKKEQIKELNCRLLTVLERLSI